MRTPFTGCGTALVTPFTSSGAVDEAAVRRLAKRQVEAGVHTNIFRVLFHEITERGINEAMQNPLRIDDHLVNSQQARRAMDRLVGYKISPFIWKTLFYGLSAGRVQASRSG